MWGRAGKPRDLAVTRTACRIAGVGICVPAWVSPEQAQHFPSCVPQARQPGGSSPTLKPHLPTIWEQTVLGSGPTQVTSH